MIRFYWLFGMALGLLFADEEDCEEFDMNWAVTIQLLIFAVTVAKYKE